MYGNHHAVKMIADGDGRMDALDLMLANHNVAQQISEIMP